jgi:acylphosphatase
MTERVTHRLAIRGMVQGVGFRYSMQREAERLGVSGYVRNRVDGSVEAVVQGSRAQVEAITAWARRGPRSARVDAVETSPAAGDFAGFEARPTY